MQTLSGFICKVTTDEGNHLMADMDGVTLCGLKNVKISSPQLNLRAIALESFGICADCARMLELKV